MDDGLLDPAWKAVASLFRRRPSPDVVEIDPLVEDLWPLEGPEFTVNALRTLPEEALRGRFTGDLAYDNLLLNKWEFADGRAVLESYPWRLSVPFLLCNAQCEFCAAWLIHGKSRLLDLIEALTPVIRRAWQLDLVGWGEPLLHPEFPQVLDILRREASPRARMALTTNGVLLERWVDRLLEANVTDYAVSVHAATAPTHQTVMGFAQPYFDRVIAGVRALCARRSTHPQLFVELVLVVTNQNIAEIPAFIAMAAGLGVDRVHLRTMMPMEALHEGIDYHRIPPYLHPDFEVLRRAAEAAIAAAPLPVNADPAAWSRPIFPPALEAEIAAIPARPKTERKSYEILPIDWDALGAGEPEPEPEPAEPVANLMGRTARYYCPSPYTAFYVNGSDRRVIPCVYMHKAPGHAFMHFKPDMTFNQVWNGPAMVAVRKALHGGPLMSPCLKCPAHC